MTEEFCLVDNHDIKNTSKFRVKGVNKTLDNCADDDAASVTRHQDH